MSNTPEGPQPDRTRPRRRRVVLATVLAAALVLLSGAGLWAFIAAQQSANTGSTAASEAPPTPETDPSPAPDPAPEPEPEPDPEPQWDIDSPDSITVVVNKQRPLTPEGWAPDDLVMPDVPNNNGQPMRKPAARAIEKMHAAASADGAPFVIASAYRPYDMQVDLFQSYVNRDGVEAAETYSARPGHSEHQTGLVADVDDGSGCAFEFCFGATAAGAWIRENANRYGFIVRYPEGQQETTGYIYEPYHLRYVGKEVAGLMHEQGVETLEEFFGLDPAPTY
ncbi:D-alanyl-D-alanine carboxypeptidase family protein [Leucobacter soli]|nr:M15 family metallopeptidase [Leucobacter soli]